MKVLIFLISCFAMINPMHERTYQLQKVTLDVDGSKAFAAFLSHFEKSESALTIDHFEIAELKSKFLGLKSTTRDLAGSNSSDLKNFIPEIKNGNFSRIGPPIVKPLNRFYTDENTIAVTYLTRHVFNESGFQIKVALYDLKGNYISKEKPMKKGSLKRMSSSTSIAGVNIESTTICSFQNPDRISSVTYKNVWEKDAREFGIEDNRITSYEKLETNVLQLSSDGIVAVTDEKSSYASLK